MDVIFKKIDDAAAFVADLTFVGKALDENPVPNPNVLIEYGWALKTLKHERTIYLMNTAYGEADEKNLPFDLRHLRWPIRYHLPEDVDGVTKAKVRKELIRDLGKAIRLSLAVAPNEEMGILAEWMDPEWFKFAGSSYSNLIPTQTDLWLQVYFRNTTDSPQTLQSAKAEFIRDGRFWGGAYRGMRPTFNSGLASSVQLVPKSIPAKDAVPFYFHFDFSLGARSPEEFIAQLSESPDLLFKIIYETKEGAETRSKSIERSLSFSKEFKPIYKSFLAGSPRPEIPALIQSLEA